MGLLCSSCYNTTATGGHLTIFASDNLITGDGINVILVFIEASFPASMPEFEVKHCDLDLDLDMPRSISVCEHINEQTSSDSVIVSDFFDWNVPNQYKATYALTILRRLPVCPTYLLQRCKHILWREIRKLDHGDEIMEQSLSFGLFTLPIVRFLEKLFRNDINKESAHDLCKVLLNEIECGLLNE